MKNLFYTSPKYLQNLKGIKSSASEIDGVVLKTASFVSPEIFGAIGDGVTDDTQAFINMNNSDVLNIKLTSGKTYLISNWEITNAYSIVDLNGAKIIKNIVGNRDELVSLSAPSILFCNGFLDGNSLLNGYMGRGELLTVSSSSCKIVNIYSSNNVSTLNSTGFYIKSTAINTIVTDCTSNKSGYSGLRNKGENTVLNNFTAIDFDNKGVVCDYICNKFTIDGFIASSINANTAMDAILIDPDINGQVENLHLTNIVVSGIESFISGNAVKIINTTNSFIRKMNIIHNTPNIASLRLAGVVTNIYMEDSFLDREINSDSTVINKILLTNVTIGDDTKTALSSCFLDLGAELVIADRCNFINFTSNAFKASSGSPNVVLKGRTYFKTSSSATAATLIGLVGATPVLGGVKIESILRNGTYATSYIHGSSANDKLSISLMCDRNLSLRMGIVDKNGSTGTSGQVLTANGDGTCEWK